MNVSKIQLCKIHIAKKELGLSEDSYRTILNSFNVSSSKELSESQAGELLNKFKQLGWVPKPPVSAPSFPPKKTLQYDELKNRPSKYATPKQLRKIKVMWVEISREKTDDSLNHFIKRVVGIDRIEWLLMKDVSKVINGLRNIYARDRKKQIEELKGKVN